MQKYRDFHKIRTSYIKSKILFNQFLNKYTIHHLIKIFNCYIQVTAGTDFFLDTIVFTIKSRLDDASLKDIIILLNLSKRSIWEKRYYSNSHFNDVFEDIQRFIINKINLANRQDLINITSRLVELGYSN